MKVMREETIKAKLRGNTVKKAGKAELEKIEEKEVKHLILDVEVRVKKVMKAAIQIGGNVNKMDK